MEIYPVLQLLTEQTFGELVDDLHDPGQVDQVDLLVAHRQTPLATRDGFGDLGRRPDGDMVPAYATLVQDVGNALHLVSKDYTIRRVVVCPKDNVEH